ncbi:AMP-binding protein [Phenylobacterium montanum]|uniref:AMP-binding protein n=1 Tax=Phenylobacterium montanum TaxID=2823693 RepID=A0A975FXU6_9CAUL|nr:AMP-binding protein [Caulobacter sp. S6]QUD86932.1 AMP-binding protein [Caulobacter sp. S6]
MAEALMSLGEALRRLAASQGEAPAVTCEGRTLTYAEFNARTNRIARAMAAKGVKLGDLVTIGLPNSIGFVEACFAAWKLGATPQPISFRLPKAEVEAICDLADPPLVVALDSLETDRPRFDIDALLALSDDDSELPDAVAPILKAPTSGGSTGRPKLILSGSPGVTANTPTLDGQRPWRLEPDDAAVIPAPLYHNGPFGCALAILTLGAHLVLIPRFDAEGTLAAIDQHRGSWIYLVPTMMSRIWKLPDEVKAGYDISSLRVLWHLAAPCPPALKEAWIDWVGPETVLELYAGTEAQAITTITGTEWLSHRGSVGQVKAGEMTAMSEAGEPLPPGQVGEIYMRRPEGAPATYQYRGATARTLPGGWESLGDIGWFDEDGYLYLADRRTDMILVGGSNVYPAEIEAALDEHPLVASSAVIGLPHEDLGSTVHAIVQPREGLDEAQLRAHLAERLVTYKQPRSYEFVEENIRDDAGKVRRTALRDERVARMKGA